MAVPSLSLSSSRRKKSHARGERKMETSLLPSPRGVCLRSRPKQLNDEIYSSAARLPLSARRHPEGERDSLSLLLAGRTFTLRQRAPRNLWMPFPYPQDTNSLSSLSPHVCCPSIDPRERARTYTAGARHNGCPPHRGEKKNEVRFARG